MSVSVLTAALPAGCARDEVPVYGADPFARDPAPLGPFAGKILTSNVGDDTLSVVDPALPGPAGRLPVGFNPVELEGPHHLAADPAGRFIYVNLSLAVQGSGSGPHGVHGAGDQPGFVLKLDAVTGKEVDRVKVDPNPGDSTLSPDGRVLYVTHYDEIKWRRGLGASNLIAVDTARMVILARRPLCPAAHGVRLSADGARLYATCGPDAMAVVELADPTFPATVVPVPSGGPLDAPSCQRCPYALSVAPDGTVWLSNLGPNGGGVGRGSVEVYDPATQAFDPVRRVPLRGRPVFAAFVPGPAPTEYRVLIPEQVGPGDAVHVYAPGAAGVAPERLGGIELDPAQCLNAHMMLVDASGQRGYLICEGDHRGPGSFVWLDLPGQAVLGAVATGVFPDGLVLVPPRVP
jgi:DNA-binding beta-propeller fold protein YncE